MTSQKDKEIKRLKKRVAKLEATLKIVTRHSGKSENRMRKQFEVVSETIPVPMIISNAEGKIVFANPRARQTFGYAPEAVSEMNASDLYGNSGDRKLFLKILDAKGEVDGFRSELKTACGTLFPAIMFARGIHFNDEDAILTVVHDLSEVMALEKQVRQAHKMEAIGTLASGIAHDFNNILAAIFGYTDMLALLLTSEENRKPLEYLEKVQQAAGRAKSMILQMSAFYRQSEKEKKNFRIGAIVSEVVKMMGELTPSNIRLHCRMENREMMVSGDPTQIHQVVTNLVTNAVQALSDVGGAVTVGLEQARLGQDEINGLLIPGLGPGNHAVITVKDNGPGIDPAIIHNIFDPFFTTKPVGKGSGMGLAVVHGIIRGHNGSLSVESTPVRGTVFRCYFPLVERHAESLAQTDGKPLPAEKGREKILLVDDEPQVLDIWFKLLGKMGYQVTPCGGGEKALLIFKNTPDRFDLVITDNTMPGMSGTELSVEILGIRPDMPIILITGDLVREGSEYRKFGIRAHVRKPFDKEQIRSIIRSVLSGHEA